MEHIFNTDETLTAEWAYTEFLFWTIFDLGVRLAKSKERLDLLNKVYGQFKLILKPVAIDQVTVQSNQAALNLVRDIQPTNTGLYNQTNVGLNLNNDATDFFNQADDIDFGIKNFKNVKSSPLTFLLAWVSGQVTFSDIQNGQIAQKLQKFELSRKEARKQISDSVKSTFFEILTFKWLRVFLKKVVSEKEDMKVESFTIG